MKKTIEFILTATAALSVALAGSAAQISGTDFESMKLGGAVQYNAPDTQGSTDYSYWYTASGAFGSSITNGFIVSTNDTGPVTVPAGFPNAYTNKTHAQYLQLSSAEELMRTVNTSGAGGVISYDLVSNGDLYVDMLVKFTPSDIPPSTNETDKLVVWMNSSSNLVVRGGYYDASWRLNRHDYVLDDCGIKPDSWHRLTIRTYVQPPDEQLPVFFTVQVDGVNQSCSSQKICDDKWVSRMDGTDEDNTYITQPCVKLFNSNSLFVSPVKNSTISYVSFTGAGSIDDISFTHEEPVFAGGGETLLSFTLALGDGLTGFEYVVGDGASAPASGDVVTNVAANTVVTIKSITPADWYTNVASLSNATDGVTVDSVNTNFTVTADNATGVVSAVKASVADVVGTTVEGVSVEQLQAWANANGLDYSAIVAADATKTANAFLMNTSDLTADPVLKVASIVKGEDGWTFTFTKAASSSSSATDITGTSGSNLNIYGTIYVYESDDLSNWGDPAEVTVTEGTVTITPTKNFFKFKVDVGGLGGGNNNN